MQGPSKAKVAGSNPAGDATLRLSYEQSNTKEQDTTQHMTKKKNTQQSTYTAYIVKDSSSFSRRFLSFPVYTGRNTKAWTNQLENAHVFNDRRSASACASDINRRTGPNPIQASVVPVQIFRRS